MGNVYSADGLDENGNPKTLAHIESLEENFVKSQIEGISKAVVSIAREAATKVKKKKRG